MGLLSAAPEGKPIVSLIRKAFSDVGFEIIDNLKQYAVVDTSLYGVPQVRKRVIIIGLNKAHFSNPQRLLKNFYRNILPKYKTPTVKTVQDAIGDLPPCTPIDLQKEENPKARVSHGTPKIDLSWHVPRYHNQRDISIFHTLSDDIESGKNQLVH